MAVYSPASTDCRSIGRWTVLVATGLLAIGLATPRPACGEEKTAQAARVDLSPELRDRCLAVLRAGLRSDEFWPSIHAAEGLTLAGQGDEVRTFLEPKLKAETDDQRRCGLARELARAGDRTKVALLLDVLADKESNGRIHAAESLFKIGEIDDGRAVREAFSRSDNPMLRIMAAAALARCGNVSALAFLRARAADDDPKVSRIASWVLGRLGDDSDLPQLRRNAGRAADALTRAFSEHALAALGDPDGQAALRRNLDSRDTAIRVYAATFAGDAGMSSAAEGLTKLLDDTTADVRIRAAQSLLVLARPAGPDPREDISRDVYPATEANPRYTEGSIVVLRDGSLLFAVTEFDGGSGDFASARIVARRSRDGGRSWGEPRVLQENVGGMNVMSATLRHLAWPVRDETPLGMFYLVKNSFDNLQVHLRISTDNGRTFGPPVRVTRAPGYHVMNNDRVTLLSTGRLLAPAASTPDVRKVNHFVSRCWISDDGGKTWRAGKGSVDLPERGAMEPEVLELDDGRVLMIVRTQLGYIAASHSADGGETWSKPASWGVQAPEAPATLRRIPATGDLLLVWNNTWQKGAGHGGKRTPLTAAVSTDEGRTWKHVRNLEARSDETYAYTSLTFFGDRALLSYWIEGGRPRRYSCRFRSLSVSWFYGNPGRDGDVK